MTAAHSALMASIGRARATQASRSDGRCPSADRSRPSAAESRSTEPQPRRERNHPNRDLGSEILCEVLGGSKREQANQEDERKGDRRSALRQPLFRRQQRQVRLRCPKRHPPERKGENRVRACGEGANRAWESGHRKDQKDRKNRERHQQLRPKMPVDPGPQENEYTHEASLWTHQRRHHANCRHMVSTPELDENQHNPQRDEQSRPSLDQRPSQTWPLQANERKRWAHGNTKVMPTARLGAEHQDSKDRTGRKAPGRREVTDRPAGQEGDHPSDIRKDNDACCPTACASKQRRAQDLVEAGGGRCSRPLQGRP